MSNTKPITGIAKVFWVSLGIVFSGAISVLLFVLFLSRDLPSLEQLENYDPDLVTRIYSSDGKILSELFLQKRVFVELPNKVSETFFQPYIPIEVARVKAEKEKK